MLFKCCYVLPTFNFLQGLPCGYEGEDVLQTLCHVVHTTSLSPHSLTGFVFSVLLSAFCHSQGEMLLRW